MKVEDRFIQVGSNHFHVRTQGQGKPLLALHGFSQSALTWEKLEISGYQVFALDLIGHGRSSKPDTLEEYSLSSILQQLATVVDILFHGKNYSLLGYSMGGRLALQFAHRFPAQPIENLFLESAALGISDPIQRAKRKQDDLRLADQIEQNGAAWFADYWGGLPIFASQNSLSKKLQHKVWASRAQNSPHALAQTLRATGQGVFPDISEMLKDLNIPLVYITGALDEKYSQIAQALSLHKKVKSIVIEGAGHNVHLELPQHFNLILANHLQGKAVL